MAVLRISRISVSRLFYTSLALLAACARPSVNQSAPAESDNQSTTLEVINRSSSDMDLYLVRRGDRVRLGLAPANVNDQVHSLSGLGGRRGDGDV